MSGVIKKFDLVSSNPGTPYRKIRQTVVNEDGTMDVVVVGKENTDDYIKSFAQSCDINYIVSRFNAGDTSVLNRKTPMYGDFTEAPKTYAEMLQMVIDTQNLFDSLPSDIRAGFSNDYAQFIAKAGSDEFNEVFKKYAENVKNIDVGSSVINTNSLDEKVKEAGEVE